MDDGVDPFDRGTHSFPGGEVALAPVGPGAGLPAEDERAVARLAQPPDDLTAGGARTPGHEDVHRPQDNRLP